MKWVTEQTQRVKPPLCHPLRGLRYCFYEIEGGTLAPANAWRLHPLLFPRPLSRATASSPLSGREIISASPPGADEKSPQGGRKTNSDGVKRKTPLRIPRNPSVL